MMKFNNLICGDGRTVIKHEIDIAKEWKMNKLSLILRMALASGFWLASGSVFAAYSSGSTGADGAFNPTASQSVPLPPDGVFNYTGVNIPAGVTITYTKNAANTPVTILVSGDATIAGTLDVSGTPPVSSADVSGSGLAGPGGYSGGRGGQPGGAAVNWTTNWTTPNIGRAGVGPGGGNPGPVHLATIFGKAIAAGGGGAYGEAPPPPGSYCPSYPGAVYGNITLIPLIGGSGGGGGAGGTVMPGSGGGGGGGAILIASSGVINITGAILANGGAPVATGTLDGRGSLGGGGSGGAIRLIATTVSGNGTISAAGGVAAGGTVASQSGNTYYLCDYGPYNNGSGSGGAGRIRIEAETLSRTVASTPPWVGGAPSLAFVPGMPTLTISNVGGVTVPAQPTGSGDIALPTGFTNPVTVTFVTSGVTVGSSIKLTVIPVQGLAYGATSAPTTGTTGSATASVAVTLPSGPNTLQASVTYTVLASVGDAMSVYALGERVEKVTLASTLGSKESTVTLTTVSGKEYVVPASALLTLQS
jgi:hypothetical protein